MTADDLPLVSASAFSATIVCAIVGGMDLGGRGALVGGLAGFFAGVLFGYSLSLLAEFIFGTRPAAGEPQQPSVTHRMLRGMLRLLQLTFLAAVAYELFWFAQFQTLCLDYQVGQMLDHTAFLPEAHTALKVELEQKRWAIALPTTRPFVWVVQPAYREENRATLAVIDWVTTERAPPAAAPPPVLPAVDPGKVTPVAAEGGLSFLPKDANAAIVSDARLREVGQAVMSHAEQMLAADKNKTLLMRFISNETLLMKQPPPEPAPDPAPPGMPLTPMQPPPPIPPGNARPVPGSRPLTPGAFPPANRPQ